MGRERNWLSPFKTIGVGERVVKAVSRQIAVPEFFASRLFLSDLISPFSPQIDHFSCDRFTTAPRDSAAFSMTVVSRTLSGDSMVHFPLARIAIAVENCVCNFDGGASTSPLIEVAGLTIKFMSSPDLYSFSFLGSIINDFFNI
jgi:hypothetical protein